MKERLHRTQLYINQDLLTQLRFEARHRGVSMAQLVRDLLTSLMNERRKPDWRDDSIFELRGFIGSKERDFGANHDHYLYGRKR